MTEHGAPFVDDFLPRFDVQSRHSTVIGAPAAHVYRLTRELDISRSPIVRSLFRLRGLPASARTLDDLAKRRFLPLLEQPPAGFVLGLVGQFWRPAGRLVDFDPTEFAAFQPPGYAKAIWSFDVTPLPGSRSRLRTVTRVVCPDRKTRRSFKLYWAFVGPFSGLVRREILRSVKRACENGRSLDGAHTHTTETEESGE
ncbi:MAG: hypothetical protein HKO53_17375 [Gemmatimonadetes bacterium]|nr:hypothetical protein [Gemmatimonadota bacterium]